MRRPVRYPVSPPDGDRVHHVSPDDVRVVLSRLPEDAYDRLNVVHFNDQARGDRTLGYPTTRGRREVALCALPPRMSRTPFLTRRQSPREFGARRGAQWPTLAIRRFLLYDVLLHEIGHLQIIVPGHRNPNREFASESKAQEFADLWRRELWSRPFDHPDPVHNPPSADELVVLD